MNRKQAAAAAKAALRHGYFAPPGADPYVTCPAPCREKVTVDRFGLRGDLVARLRAALTDHMAEEH